MFPDSAKDGVDFIATVKISNVAFRRLEKRGAPSDKGVLILEQTTSKNKNKIPHQCRVFRV